MKRNVIFGLLITLNFCSIGCQFFSSASNNASNNASSANPNTSPPPFSNQTTISSVSPPLSAPYILQPRNVWVLDETPSLIVQPSRGTRRLHLEIALDSSFQLSIDRMEVPVVADIDKMTIPISKPLNPGEEIHLRICGLSEDGDQSEWRVASPLRVALTRPRIIETDLLADGSMDAPTFFWTEVPKSTGYHVELYKNAQLSSPVFTLQVDDPTKTYIKAPGPLPGPGEYCIRARAIAVNYVGEWSYPQVFNVDPPRCKIVAPSNGALLSGRRPRIQWQPAQKTSDSTRFEIEVAMEFQQGTFSSPHYFSVSQTSFQPEEFLEKGSRYKVRVRQGTTDPKPRGARDDSSDWSAPIVFSIMKNRQDTNPVTPIAVDSRFRASSPAVSADGQLLVYVEESAVLFPSQEPLGTRSSPRRRIKILECVFEEQESCSFSNSRPLKYRPLKGARERYPGIYEVEGNVCHPTWGLSENRDPYLLFSTAICEQDSPFSQTVNSETANSGTGISETRGAIFQFHRQADRDANLLPHLFERTILHISTPANPGMSTPTLPTSATTGIPTPTDRSKDGAPYSSVHHPTRRSPRIFFEAQSLECLDSPETPAIGEIWSIRTDGTDLRLHGLGHSPVISPDGKTLALINYGSNGFEVRLRSSRGEGGPGRPLVISRDPSHLVRGLAWSPTGKELAFSRNTSEGFDLFLVDVATGVETQVTQDYADDVDPVFLPDPLNPSGYSGLFFASTREGKNWGIYLVSTDGQ